MLAPIVSACQVGGMSTPDQQTCEVKIGGVWRAMGLDEVASQHAMAVKRCPSCHGRVSIHGTYSGPNVRRTLYHRRAHNGCPLKPEAFCGTSLPHPQALS